MNDNSLSAGVPFSEATFAGKSYCTDPGSKDKSRQVTFVADMVADMEELNNPDSLEMLVGVQWQVILFGKWPFRKGLSYVNLGLYHGPILYICPL